MVRLGLSVSRGFERLRRERRFQIGPVEVPGKWLVELGQLADLEKGDAYGIKMISFGGIVPHFCLKKYFGKNYKRIRFTNLKK